MDLREQIARAIWAKRPDCQRRPWPIETSEQRRAYPHNPVAACDLCYIYADAAIAAMDAAASHEGEAQDTQPIERDMPRSVRS